MHINFRIIKNTHDEIAMGHKIWFELVPGCDVISATANAPGFTPLIAVARHHSWDHDLLAFKELERSLLAHVQTHGGFMVPATDPLALPVCGEAVGMIAKLSDVHVFDAGRDLRVEAEAVTL